jgi:hypothetical protein
LVSVWRAAALAAWATHRLHWWPLPVLALLIQLVLYTPPFDAWPIVVAAGPFLGLGTMAAVAVVLFRNGLSPRRPACLIAVVGIVLNLTVMLANDGRMPRADELAARPGQIAAWSATEPTLSNVTPAGEHTRLALLGDIIAEPGWIPSSNVFSIGDVLLAFGLTVWSFQITRRPAQRQTV